MHIIFSTITLANSKRQATPAYHPSVCNLSDVEGFATSDLFKPHPHKDYLWKMCVFFTNINKLFMSLFYSVGRLDDVIIHTSGEKTVPLPMESVMMSNPQYVTESPILLVVLISS